MTGNDYCWTTISKKPNLETDFKWKVTLSKSSVCENGVIYLSLVSSGWGEGGGEMKNRRSGNFAQCYMMMALTVAGPLYLSH